MSTLEANITPEVARWARERVGLPVETIAVRLNVKPEKVSAWEEGDELPTFRQAQTLARTLSIPFGYLFLSEPPELTTSLPDLRTVGGRETKDVSPEFLDLLYEVIIKQQWYRDYLVDESRKPCPFVGRFNVNEHSIEEVSKDIRQALSINDSLREESASWSDFLRKLILNAESLGVLVLRSGVVRGNNKRTLSVDEFRGFVLPQLELERAFFR